MLHLEQLLLPEELARAQALLGDDAPWLDGRRSAGAQAGQVKHNQQLAQDSQASRELQPLILAALQRDALFASAALPRRILPPLFNRYAAPGQHYGAHIDSAILPLPGGQRMRGDLSCTVFLSDPESYEGGELRIQDGLGSRGVKLAAGDALLYPASTVHEVTPVTRGVRLAAFFWIESLVRSAEQRSVLFDLDMNLLRLRARHGESAETVALTGTYHNLLRMWAQA